MHRSPHRGSSIEFAEYRKYVPGDDPRRLDWQAYARSDRFYVKEFEADTNLRAYFVVDTSASMAFTSGEENKFVYARKMAAALAYLSINQGDAVGLTCCSDVVTADIPPRRSPRHLQYIFDQLEQVELKGETGLVKSLHEVAEQIPQRALVCIFSDFFCEPEELNEAFQHLRYRKHDVAVFHLLDRQELDFEFDRPYRFVDMEDKSSIVVEPYLIGDRYQEALRQYLADVRRYTYQAKADYHLVVTDEDYETLLGDFLTARLPKKKSR